MEGTGGAIGKEEFRSFVLGIIIPVLLAVWLPLRILASRQDKRRDERTSIFLRLANQPTSSERVEFECV